MQATQVRDLIDALNRHSPDIVHFSGHGAESELLFEGPDGTPLALSGEQLATLLQTAPRRIRLMVFNACNSATQAEAATEWTEFAIGMEQPIDDGAAKEWAGQFYGSLAAGQTVGRAFAQATAHAEVLTSVASAGQPRLFDNGSSGPRGDRARRSNAELSLLSPECDDLCRPRDGASRAAGTDTAVGPPEGGGCQRSTSSGCRSRPCAGSVAFPASCA